jgi:hypothetical protein
MEFIYKAKETISRKYGVTATWSWFPPRGGGKTHKFYASNQRLQ